MGWPKKDEGYRLYKEPKGEGNGGTYLLVCVYPENRTPNGDYEAVGEMLIDNNPNKPRVATTSVSPSYLARCRRVAWDDLPAVWQDAFRAWLPDNDPDNYRGLHRTRRHDHDTRTGANPPIPAPAT